AGQQKLRRCGRSGTRSLHLIGPYRHTTSALASPSNRQNYEPGGRMEPRIEPRKGLFAGVVAAGAKKSFGREMKSARVFARHPRMMFGFMRYNRAAEHTPRVPKPLAELVVLRVATMVGCPFCIDIASEYSRRAGLGDEQLLSLNDAHGSGLFDADQLMVIDLATGMTCTPGEVDDELLERVKARFGDKGTMELVQL